MYTRQGFEQRRAAAQAVERQDSRLLAVVSVGLGVAQWLFLSWADTHLEPAVERAIAGPAFLIYSALVAGLLWRLVRRRNATRPVCGQCGVVMDDPSARMTAATGNCAACGRPAIEPE